MRPRAFPLTIDFRPDQPSGSRRLGWGILVIGIVIAGTVAYQAYALYQARVQTEAAWFRLKGQFARPVDQTSPEARQQMKDELKRAALVIDRLDTPWDALFGAVESAFEERVTLLTVEPDTERQEVRLTAEAKDLTAMLAYLKEVRQSPVLGDAYLASHQTNLQDPQRPVRFAILARWNQVLPQDAVGPAVHAEVTADGAKSPNQAAPGEQGAPVGPAVSPSPSLPRPGGRP